jgi:hypothetical protein
MSEYDRSSNQYRRVEVTDDKGQVVAIETRMLAGRDIGHPEEAAIRWAIEQLQGFIGATYCPACGLITVPCEHCST